MAALRLEIRMDKKEPHFTKYTTSPTVLSSDLFTPLQEPRVTLPTIGEHDQIAPPAGGHSWAGPITAYGGIGGLSYLGSKRVRDLHVSRSHRHYGRGLCSHPTAFQPYRLTSLKLSDCRLNDQRLPSSMKTHLGSSSWQREAWPGHHPYFSHRSIFKIFPSSEPFSGAENQARDNNGTIISDVTSSALKNIHQQFYQTTLYRESYGTPYLNRQGGHMPVPQQSSRSVPKDIQPPVDKQGQTAQDKNNQDETESGDTQSGELTKEERDGKTDEDEENDDDETEILPFIDERDKHGKVLSLYPLPSPVYAAKMAGDSPARQAAKNHYSQRVNLDPSIQHQVMEDTIRQFKIRPNVLMTGVGPCWPPSTSHTIDNIHGSQLLERREITDFPTAHNSTLKPPLNIRRGMPVSHQSNFTIPPIQSHIKLPHGSSDPTARKDTIKLPDVKVKDKPFVVPSCFCHSIEAMTAPPAPVPKPEQKQKVVMTRGDGTALWVPPFSVTDTITPHGKRVTHKLGLRYKAEAHKRYHAMFPDPIPDLRTTNSEGKKYFFYNLHSSAFRG